MTVIKQIEAILFREVSNASLIFFRIFFGFLMFAATLRFILKGWVYDFYIAPEFHFTYYGFSWVSPLGETGMYLVFYGLLLASIFIMTGFLYRLGIIYFFLAFSYIELIDKTYYLNHYYAVSLISFLMIFMPLNRRLALDAKIFTWIKSGHLEGWALFLLRSQAVVIYFFAGIAKLNYDWLIQGQPMYIWLTSISGTPFSGLNTIAVIMSWLGMFYDISIPFLLILRKTRKIAFFSVIIFHLLTALLFNIGIFPWVMILMASLFFSPEWPEKFLKKTSREKKFARITAVKRTVISLFACGYLIIQLLLPLRYVLYPGYLFWTEEGFRFSWRVMLIEKTGMVVFKVKDNESGNTWEVSPRDYLTRLQEKMMSTQPDMILQFAHHLRDIYKTKGYSNPEVMAEAYVSLNGRPSQIFINPEADLATYPVNLKPKTFIMPLQE